ncbi:gluconate:H+ symporter [uncultured Mucilaginibacter sp.]|uniref:gluconate:H+ symporter n=1 Tax=uncultured Mucilaginibacter sp. TaxID=797541 RepID=UPI0026100A81|nr:gluconate:H+ symporter [uncultured Mucilaginibacter sp.]
MTFLIIIGCIAGLILLISAAKVHPFLAFLLISLAAGLLLGLPLDKIAGSIEKGIGDILSSLVILITLGAMFGKLVAVSGAAQRIAAVIVNAAGKKNIQWAMMTIGFIIGIPLFYGIGFVLMVPLIFSVVYKYKLPAVAIGLPMLAALSVTHGFLPPHPSPSALVTQFHANMGLTLFYGILLAVPAIIIAGPVFSSTLKKMPSQPLKSFVADELPEDKLPGSFNSFFTAVLPVLLLMATTIASFAFPATSPLHPLIALLAAPSIVLMIAITYATFSLGIFQGKNMPQVMGFYVDAVKDIASILLIIAGSGALKQVLTDTGVNAQFAGLLQNLHMQPLVLGWLIAAIIRICVGSATVAGLTTVGIILPIMVASHTNPNLMVLAVGAGSLAFSHVNDSGFWLFKEYFNLSVKNTFLSWSVMESIVAFVGLAGVLILNSIL